MKVFTSISPPLLFILASMTAVAAVTPSPPCQAQIDACNASHGHTLRMQSVCDDTPTPAHGTFYMCAHTDGSMAFLTECEPHCPAPTPTPTPTPKPST
ncbi:hypothetical protein FPV67DRAFT_585862 [Lyophyllum atratum]|nr:hypothetical protein FPV67DRAFT_585862 [Lyophyllum atratum]